MGAAFSPARNTQNKFVIGQSRLSRKGIKMAQQKKKIKNLETDTHVFFLTSEFSQWYPSDFRDEEGHEFATAEEYMMFHKATLFGDHAIAAQILATNDPKRQKALGRQVAGFDKAVWDQHAKAIVKKGNSLKFTQNPDLWDVLNATGDKKLVEAADYDPIWVIGFCCDDTEALGQPERWGLNWLGESLTELRDELRALGFEPFRGLVEDQKLISMRDRSGQRWLRITPKELADQLGRSSSQDLRESVERAPATDTVIIQFKGLSYALSEPMGEFRARNQSAWAALEAETAAVAPKAGAVRAGWRQPGL